MPTSKRARLRAFAEDYTAAWCSQDPARVAAHYSPDGSLTINGGAPAVGREAIAAAARAFMSAFPDLKVTMNSLEVISGNSGDRDIFHWTLDGTNTGPGGKGNRVRISGYEEWRFGADGLIAESQRHFDAAEYQRQIEQGCDGHKK